MSLKACLNAMSVIGYTGLTIRALRVIGYTGLTIRALSVIGYTGLTIRALNMRSCILKIKESLDPPTIDSVLCKITTFLNVLVKAIHCSQRRFKGKQNRKRKWKKAKAKNIKTEPR